MALRKAGCDKKEKRESLVFNALGALFSASSCLLGQKNGLDVGQDTSLGDGDSAQQLVQLLVVADGELEVAWVDPLFLVVSSGVPGQLQDLSS